MEVLKTLLIVVIIFAVGINGEGEESKRGARCNSNKSIGKQQQRHKGHMRKPYPLLHHEELKFQRKKEFPTKVIVVDPSSLSHANSDAKAELKKPVQNPKVAHEQETEDTFNMFMHGDELVADPMEIPSTFGITPRLSISADGEIKTARSLSFNKNRNFHDDSIVEYIHAHDHMDEDNDHFHKIRTTRNAPSGKDSGPQQLSSTLGQLHGAHSAQGIDVHNGASAGEYLNLSASGDQISAANQGSSSASGSGIISSSGSTTITTSGKNQ